MNLPVVPQEKYDKLAAVVTKIFGTAYQIREGAHTSGQFGWLLHVAAFSCNQVKLISSAHGRGTDSTPQLPAMCVVLSWRDGSWVGTKEGTQGGCGVTQASVACPAGGFFMPKDESGMSKGFAFIEFVNQQVGQVFFPGHGSCLISMQEQGDGQVFMPSHAVPDAVLVSQQSCQSAAGQLQEVDASLGECIQQCRSYHREVLL
jgi:hypothetical protein